jgi:HK97 family phage portal protein
MAPTVGIYGCGWLEQCLPEATLLRNINDYERAMMDNNGRPDFAVKYKGGSLAPEQRRSLGKMFRAMFTGGRKGEPFIADGDFDIVPFGWSPKDLSYEQGKKDCRLVVCNCAGVPIDLIDSRDSNRATSLTAFRSYSILTIDPKLRRYEDTINAQLTSHFDDGIFLKFDSPVPIDEEQELKEEMFEVTTGIVSINEARAKRGLEPLPEDMRGSPAKAQAAIGDDQKDKGQE